MSLLSKFDMSVKNLQILKWTDSLLTNLASISISNIFSLFKYHLNKGKSFKKIVTKVSIFTTEPKLFN